MSKEIIELLENIIRITNTQLRMPSEEVINKQATQALSLLKADTCPTCGGSGTKKYTVSMWGDENLPMSKPCPRCQPSDDDEFVKRIRVRYSGAVPSDEIPEELFEALTRLSQQAKQIEQLRKGDESLAAWMDAAHEAKVELIKKQKQIERLEGEKKGLQEKLRKLCELSCLEDITKESGRDFVCSMRINEVAFVEAKEPLKVIDYVFNSMKKQFYKKVKALKKGE